MKNSAPGESGFTVPGESGYTVPGESGYKCGKPSSLIFPKTSNPGRKGYSPSLLYKVLETIK